MQYEGFLGPGAKVVLYAHIAEPSVIKALAYPWKPLTENIAACGNVMVWHRTDGMVSLRHMPKGILIEVPAARVIGLRLQSDPPQIASGDQVKVKLVHKLDNQPELTGTVESKTEWSITLNVNGTVWEIPWSNVVAVEAVT
jgi:hypothetical protein